MKPTPFTYHRPTTVDEVLTLLAELDDAELLAGNQSLGIIMSNRLATPDHLIDLNSVDSLAGVDADEETIRVGAMTRHRTIERSELLGDRLPMLPAAAQQIAGPMVRNRGTIGGSLAEADPAGNYPAALVALDGTLRVRSAGETRDVDAREFFIAYMFTDLREDELIETVEIPTTAFPPERSGMAFEEMKPSAQSFPTISAATAIRVTDATADEPAIEEARIALANAADIPLHVPEAEQAIEGSSLDDAGLDAAANAAAEAANAAEGQHVDEAFKEDVAAEYTRRALQTAYETAATRRSRSSS